MNIFLDTNIIIEAGARKEHHDLIALAKKGIINLFISLDILGEQKYRQLLWFYNKNSLGKLEQIEENDKKEWKFWQEVNFESADDCSFSKLVDYSLNKTEEEILKFDNKGEYQLLDELKMKFKIKDKDSINIMVAHSANMDYFLTWDNDLIKKTKQVLWLRPKVATPFDFIQTMSKRLPKNYTPCNL